MSSNNFAADIHIELHDDLISEFGWETEPWVSERLERVIGRLNATRSGNRPPLIAHSLSLPSCSAFTTPTTNIYVSRRLMEVLSSDDMVAMILAHEIAHHDLGHLDLFEGALKLIPRGVGGSLAVLTFRLFEDQFYGPEREAAADLFAVDLCGKAGYNVERCIQAFTKLEQEHLNAGDIDGVYGPENLLDPTDPHQGSTAYAVQRWLWIRAHRYLPLHERRARAIAHYEETKGGSGASSTEAQ
ncbi:MAG: M48 family metalloprotease [Gemmatimonadaceae bacterium]